MSIYNRSVLKLNANKGGVVADLAVGDRIPDFDLPCDPSGRMSRDSLAGAPFVLYFYPKDNSGRCIGESVDFSRLLPQFWALGVAVAGISPDSLRKHAAFRAKQDLTVPLLSDGDRSVSMAFGVWVEKVLYGRAYMGVERATFLVDKDGIVRRVWRKVRVDGHAAAVLEAARQA